VADGGGIVKPLVGVPPVSSGVKGSGKRGPDLYRDHYYCAWGGHWVLKEEAANYSKRYCIVPLCPVHGAPLRVKPRFKPRPGKKSSFYRPADRALADAWRRLALKNRGRGV